MVIPRSRWKYPLNQALHFTVRQAAEMDNTVGKRGFAVINMGDN